jgi:Domain of unknown function (DUF5666)
MASRPLNTPSGSTKGASSVKSTAKAVALLTSENRALRGNCLVFGQPISADRRFFNMKTTMFALVLAIGMAFSAFAADEPSKIKLEGVIQQLPAVRLLGIWMVSERAVFVTEATVIEEEDGPVRVGAKVDVEGFVQPDGSIMATNIETDE